MREGGHSLSYDLSWYIPNKVLYLKFSEKPALDEFKAANQAILNALRADKTSLFLIIDVQNLKPDLASWDNLRSTQTYMNDTNLEFVLVIGDNKNRLVRLMMLVVFNVSKSGLKFFQTVEEVNVFLKRFSLEPVHKVDDRANDEA